MSSRAPKTPKTRPLTDTNRKKLQEYFEKNGIPDSAGRKRLSEELNINIKSVVGFYIKKAEKKKETGLKEELETVESMAEQQVLLNPFRHLHARPDEHLVMGSTVKRQTDVRDSITSSLEIEQHLVTGTGSLKRKAEEHDEELESSVKKAKVEPEDHGIFAKMYKWLVSWF
ncbi:unnamed protein product [Caenorhabditis sp. 36 PRJEB53466]|nr:unnamed protein product [Caenorhabditis sp. 36 PRJEB53466]